MIAIDTNILVYAHRTDSPWHGRAREVLAEVVASRTAWAIPWHCLHEFYTTVTRARYYRPPSTVAQAIDQIEAWLEVPNVTLLGEDAPTWLVLRQLLVSARIIGPAIYDARVAAVCLRYGVTELWSHDRDFSRYPTLRVRNPLIDILPARGGEARAVYKPSVRARPKSKAGVRR